MRRAEVLDAWRKLRFSKNKTSGIKFVEYSGVVGLTDGSIEFSSPFTAICGLNGVGKSALLKALLAAVDPLQAGRTQASFSRFAAAKINVCLYLQGEEKEFSYGTNAEDASLKASEHPSIKYFDAASEVINLRGFFRDIKSVEDALNGIGPVELSENELREISYIAGKNYVKAQIFEIDSFDPPKIYFKVSERGASYELEDMSFGEISCFILFWTIRQAKKGTLFLLEEPETYISPAAQEKMADYLVFLCNSKNHSFVITTHSPRLVKALNLNEMKLLVQSPSGSKMVGDSDHLTIMRHIGLESHKKCILLLEDRAAREFIKALLYTYDRTVLAEVDALDLGGEGNITSVLGIIPIQKGQIKFVGVYDGDMKGRISDLKWSFTFLPLEGSIEHKFLEIVENYTDKVAVAIKCSPAEVNMMHSSLAGRDTHDHFIEFGRGLDCSYEKLMHVLVEVLTQDPIEDAKMKEFCDNLVQLIRSP